MITKFSVCFLAVLFSAAAVIPLNSQYAGADHVIILQCTPGQLEFNEYLYKENINGINDAVSLYQHAHPNSPTSDLFSYMGKLYVWMKVVPDYAHCLRDMGVDPSSIVQLTPQAANLLITDANDLSGFSPDFLKEVPITGFTNSAYFPAVPIPVTQEPPPVPDCHDRSFPSVNWSFCNFSGANLGQAYLLGANLTGINVSGTKLDGAYAFDAVLKSANLGRSDLRHTELAGANLGNANLAGADLSYGSLDFANLQGGNLRDANLFQTHGLFPVFYNATLAGANLGNSDYVRANFEKANLAGSNLTNTNLTGADLNGTNLTNADLKGAVLTGANLHCIGNPVCR